MLSSLQALLAASFDGISSPAWDRRHAAAGADVADLLARRAAAYLTKREALTRIRLTASRTTVITAAEQLMTFEEELQDFALCADPSQADAEFRSRKRQQNALRDELVKAARRALWLRRGPKLTNRY